MRAPAGTTLATCPVVTRLPVPRPGPAELAPYDLVRHALEARIELAKERLFADLDQVQLEVRGVAASAASALAKRVTRAVLVGSVVVLGIVAALVLRRQQRRLRIGWR